MADGRNAAPGVLGSLMRRRSYNTPAPDKAKCQAISAALERMTIVMNEQGTPRSQKRAAAVVEYAFSIKRSSELTRGSFVAHESHGKGTLIEVKSNFDVVVAFDNGDHHTYQPKSQYKLKRINAMAMAAIHRTAEVVSQRPSVSVRSSCWGDEGGETRQTSKRLKNQLAKQRAIALSAGLHAVHHLIEGRGHLVHNLLQGNATSVSLDATVEQVFDQLVRAKLVRKQHGSTLIITQAGVPVNNHRWRSLQYHNHHRHGTTTVSLWIAGLTAGVIQEATFICKTSSMSHALSGLLHGGVGAVGNYRDADTAPSWFFCDEHGRELPLRRYFVQTSHNTVCEPARSHTHASVCSGL
eukprot:6104731-Prymnesium_polylepis.2